jgi:hypothetical protein
MWEVQIGAKSWRLYTYGLNHRINDAYCES